MNDGTMELNAVRANWDQLTTKQIDAIQTQLSQQEGEAAGTPPADDGELAMGIDGDELVPVTLSSAQSDDLAAVRDLVDLAEAEIASRLG